MNPIKVMKVLETVWLVVAFLAILMAVVAAVRQDWRDVGFMLLLTLAAGFIYYRRRKQRTWLEKNNK
jgi:heme/copper-type cytochrome/quinol oxidase subunit 3